jgi:hypothetical protein
LLEVVGELADDLDPVLVEVEQPQSSAWRTCASTGTSCSGAKGSFPGCG